MVSGAPARHGFIRLFRSGVVNMLKRLTTHFVLIPALAVMGTLQSAQADWDVNAGGISGEDLQDIVITLKSDPNQDPESACLAVTFARSLSGNPKANITLFVTLDGVNLASENYISKRRLKEYDCITPFDAEPISLKENLDAYLYPENVYNPNRLVVCPLCWIERYGDELPDYGVLPGANADEKAIGQMIFNADKILDF
jgi:hypothetical protein